jgi:hypothetical protein
MDFVFRGMGVMLGMNLIALIAAILGGAVGGAVGGILAEVMGAKKLRVALIVGCGIAGGLLLKPVATPFLEASFGPAVRAAQFDAVIAAELAQMGKSQPGLARVLKDNPKIEAQFRLRLRAAFEAGGKEGMLQETASLGATVLGDAFLKYLPRARGEDLRQFASTMANVLSRFNEKDPKACILYLYGAQLGQTIEYRKVLAILGDEGERKISAMLDLIVLNSADEPIAFDSAKGQAALEAAAAKHEKLLNGDELKVATGEQLPANDDEARAACNFSIAVYEEIGAMDTPTAELALRYIFEPE